MPDADLQRALGRVEGKLDLVLKDQDDASKNRKQTYDRLETLDRKVDSINGEVARVDKRLASVERPVAEFSKWRERAIGALMLISFMSAVTGAALTAAWRYVVNWFTGT